eukprot:GHUV01030534.1.p1 GENE.GHUV01030534.1~~GHUV01030534.1.p1  ORF type:complete len:437 (+),score=68.02 GHUV01030534.1:910-2220(+)
MVAASPLVYSSLDPKDTGGVKLVAAPMDQQSCDTCAAFAVTSAAETAMASVLAVDVAGCSISVQALHFCPPKNQPKRACQGGWTIDSTLAVLEQNSQQLPTLGCLGYKPDMKGELGFDELCAMVCNAPNKYANQGSFSSGQITVTWQAQRHIRQYGAVVTRFDIYDDFRPFFSNFANMGAVYKPRPGAKPVEGHAVVLVGYNNEQNYWVAKNSWGSNWADGGYFKVAYGVCGILTAETGEAYGITWQPNVTPASMKLTVSPGPKPGCYWYKAKAGDYMSKMAWLAGISLDKFMMDNVGIVKDLDKPLEGTNLLVCNPKPGRLMTTGAPVSPAPMPAVRPVPAPQTLAPVVTTQITDQITDNPILDSLLKIKAAVDTTNQLPEWTKESGTNYGYCKWRKLSAVALWMFCKSTFVWRFLAVGHYGFVVLSPRLQLFLA